MPVQNVYNINGNLNLQYNNNQNKGETSISHSLHEYKIDLSMMKI